MRFAHAAFLWLSTALFLILLSHAKALAGEPIDVLVYSDESYPPYSYANHGEAAGIYADILRKAFSQMQGYRVHIQPVPWKRGLKQLEDGEGFALFPPYFRPLERPYMKYSTPILSENVAVFCSEAIAAHANRTRWPEDYYGLRFGLNAGFSMGGDKFAQAVSDGRIVVEQAKGNRENLLKLMLQRIDCYMNDRYSILWEWRHMNSEGLNHDNVQIVETGLVAAEQDSLHSMPVAYLPFYSAIDKLRHGSEKGAQFLCDKIAILVPRCLSNRQSNLSLPI